MITIGMFTGEKRILTFFYIYNRTRQRSRNNFCCNSQCCRCPVVQSSRPKECQFTRPDKTVSSCKNAIHVYLRVGLFTGYGVAVRTSLLASRTSPIRHSTSLAWPTRLLHPGHSDQSQHGHPGKPPAAAAATTTATAAGAGSGPCSTASETSQVSSCNIYTSCSPAAHSTADYQSSPSA